MSSLPLNPSKSFMARNPHLYPVVLSQFPPPASELKKRIRQSSKPQLNKLETKWLEYISRVHPNHTFHAQAMRFMLGNGVWYKVDVVSLSLMHCWEVKGPHAFRGGFENLKVAAHAYPEFKWTLVWIDSGRWQEQVILP